jgi:uncharacterized protein (DUF4415 family)
MNEKLTKTHLGERLEDDRTDWQRVDALTEDELRQVIRDDPDTFEPGAEWIRHVAVPHPAEVKERITMRLDADMLAWFRQQGRGYQTRMNAVLRAYYEAHKQHYRRQ